MVPVLSLTQLVSSIFGLAIGIMGAVKAAFVAFEVVLGTRMVWLCGPTGLVATEEEAMHHLKQSQRNAVPENAKTSSRPTIRTNESVSGDSVRQLQQYSSDTPAVFPTPKWPAD